MVEVIDNGIYKRRCERDEPVVRARTAKMME
jgi:hypothetical protein